MSGLFRALLIASFVMNAMGTYALAAEPTKTTIAMSPSGATAATATITFTASVGMVNGGAAVTSGAVAFFIDGAPQPAVSLSATGTASVSTTGRALGPGLHTIRADYQGVSDPGGYSPSTNSLTINLTSPIDIGGLPLPQGIVGQPYSAQLTGSGGVAPYTFNVSSGAFPAGLTLSTTGLISGTPTNAFNYNFGVVVTDSTGLRSGEKVVNLKVVAPLPSASVGPITVIEGNAATKSFGLDLVLSAPATQQITVSYATRNGTALAGSDYVASSGSITLLVGDTHRLIPLTLIGDLVPEVKEDFFLDLTGAVNATIATPTGRIVIEDDDLVTFTLDVTKTGSGTGTVTSTPGGIYCGATCSASFAGGSIVTLTAGADPSSVFVGWSGACTGTGSCTLAIDGPKAVTATFISNAYSLNVTRAGSGSGTVTSTPAGIDCGTTCSASYASGSVVTLTATPDATSTFAGWSGACSGTGNCTVTMTGDHSVSATFVRRTYALTVTRVGPGTVTSSPVAIYCGATCTATFTAGTSVTLTATPDSGASFSGWSGACTGTGPCTVTMDAAKSVGASFAAPDFKLGVTLGGTGSGTVTSSPGGISCGATCAAMFASGSVVTLTATPDATSTFAGWSGACSGTGSCVVSMTSDKAVTATFVDNTYTLSVARTGSGDGTVTSVPGGIDCGTLCAAAFTAGAVVTLTATPDATSTFAGWSGACTGSGSCAITMTTDRTVSATFVRTTYALTVTRVGPGTVTSSPVSIYCGATCTATFTAGTFVSLTATPDSGASFSGWSGACTGTGPCVVTMDAAKSVGATFTARDFDLDVTVIGSGSGTVTSSPAGIDCGATCAATYASGSVVTLTATPDATSSFAGWSGACSGTGSCVVAMTSDRVVTATFVNNTYTLTVARTGSGDGIVTSDPAGIDCGSLCAASYSAGSVVTLTATPDATSTFAGWSGACTGTGACVVTIAGNAAVSATFVRTTYALTVTRTGPGTVTSSPAGIYCGASCSSVFTAGTPVTLTATPDSGASFSGWSGACTGTGSCVVTMDAAKSVGATFAAIDRTLTVTKTGSGSGLVASVPAGIDCGSSCSATFAHGSVVTLSATPDAGSTFNGWTGACSGTGACVISMDADKAVTATFTRTNVTLAVSVIGSGSGTVTSSPSGISCPVGLGCSASFPSGTTVTLTATASAGTTFNGWGGSGAPLACTLGSSATCTFDLNGTRAIDATFTLNTYPVDVRGGYGYGQGTISSSDGWIAGSDCSGPICSTTYSHGSTLTLTATPGDANSSVYSWAVYKRDSSGAIARTSDCAGAPSTCSVTIDAETIIDLTWDGVYTLTVVRAGSGVGTVTDALGRISCGSTCTVTTGYATRIGFYTHDLTATAAPGSVFAGWSGACSGTGTCSYLLYRADATVVATFIEAPTVYLDKVGPAELEGSSGGYGDSLTWAIRLTSASPVDVTVAYATADGTAIDGRDYRGGSGTITIPAGLTVAGLSVGMFGDTTYEADETLTLTISSPTNATLGNASSTGTIINDDKAPYLTISDASVTEGNSGPAPMVFTVTLSAPAGVDVTVDYGTVDGTALGGTDFIGASGTVTFLPGETTKTIAVAAIGDLLYEANETLFVDLIRPTNASIVTARATGTIVDDDKGNTPVASITDKGVTKLEGNAGPTAFDFTVSLSAPAGVTVTVDYATADGTAASGADYVASTGTLVFLPGETSKLVSVAAVGELRFEDDETFFVDLVASTNASIGNARGTGTILNDDAPPTLDLTDVTVNEADASAVIRFTISPPSGLPLSFDYATRDSSATDGRDYTGSSGTLSLAAGATTGAFGIPIIDDAMYEGGSEQFYLDVLNLVGVRLGAAPALVTIIDNDKPPTLSILKPATVIEGTGGATTMTFTVQLSAPTDLEVAVDYATADGTARAGADYTSASGTLVFAPGSTSETFTLDITPDAMDEDDETLNVSLSDPAWATLGTASNTGTILDDDDAPDVFVRGGTATEGNSGYTPLTFTVTLSAASGKMVVISYETRDVSTEANDYVATSGTLTFAPGETTKTVDVQIVGDVRIEGDEELWVIPTAWTNATFHTSYSGTIVNDDRLTYGFGGFMSPVDAGKTYKLGSTIPIKFQLTNAAGELVSNATARIFAYKVADVVPETQPTETDLIPDGQDTFRWADDHYQYNLGTKLFTEAGLYVIFVDLDDGSTYRTTVYLKK